MQDYTPQQTASRALYLALWIGFHVLVSPVSAQSDTRQDTDSQPYHRQHRVAQNLKAGHPDFRARGADCDVFPPPPGEQWTYQVVGTSITFTTFTEEVNELVGGQVVYRIGASDSPPGLGEYIGCDPEHGEVEVATDTWDPFDPDNPQSYGRAFWEPPLYRCPFGDPVGTVCEWTGTFDGEPARTVTEVLAYESITVPFGTFDNVMKMQSTDFENGVIFDGPLLFWVDSEIGILRGEEVETGEAIELIAYTPATPTATESTALPKRVALAQNYPNPFNSRTTIPFSITVSSHVQLSIYDQLGREVTTLVSRTLAAGQYTAIWQAERVPSGIYFYRLQAGEFIETQTLMLGKQPAKPPLQ